MSANQHKYSNRKAVSITTIGKYTVIIYDQEAYDASIANDTHRSKSRPAPERTFTHKPFIKQKRIAAYSWMPAPEVLKREIQKTA